MSGLKAIDPERATGQAKQLLDAVHSTLGMAPNMAKAMANAPAVLRGWIDLDGALHGGRLDAQLREKIALTVAEANGCDYCLSAHTAIGGMVGVEAGELELSLSAESALRRSPWTGR